MKRFFWFILTFFIALTILCSCGTKSIGDDGVERDVMNYHWVVIEDMGSYQYIVYDVTTKIVYFYNHDNHNGFLTPYQTTTEDGFICGAVFEDGKIQPAPYFTP